MKIAAILAVALLSASALFADSGLGLQPSDTVATVLKRQMGQKIELRLSSGEKIAGKLESVGDTAVAISSLVGQELYEAIVVIDDISAVVVRTPVK